ncbi:MAG TPA: hypothetical protein VMM17_00170 [Gemmatimonadaceae bacterium]|nr:hypothetical protein [Gemmatimonadaceae bacterium]
MLAFVDSLCAALLARNQSEIRRLLALPLASRLPVQVREEAGAMARGRTTSFMAPVHALHFYYKLTHLIDESAEVPDISPPGERQMELPLKAAIG